MPNILYGVNGEGAGHSSRAREVIAHLEAQGHRVHVASFDRGYRNLKDDFDVTEIDGLRLAYVHNRVRYRKTVLRNLLHLPQTARMVGPSGGVQAPAAAVAAPRARDGTPGRQTSTVRSPSSEA